MATTKKGTTGKNAGAGAGKNEAKAKATAKQTKTQPDAKSKSATAPKKAAPVKLNDRQRDFLSRIKGMGESGYVVGPKAEQRTIDALVDRKLVKKGAKNKETGQQPYLLTRAGEKHLPAAAPVPAPAPAAPPEPAAMAEPAPAPPA